VILRGRRANADPIAERIKYFEDPMLKALHRRSGLAVFRIRIEDRLRRDSEMFETAEDGGEAAAGVARGSAAGVG